MGMCAQGATGHGRPVERRGDFDVASPRPRARSPSRGPAPQGPAREQGVLFLVTFFEGVGQIVRRRDF